jgi:leucyl/phenylalanyl-tRNA--protein transferase
MQARSARSDVLDPQFLLAAYRGGFFPMADAPSGEIRWYAPDPRAIFDLQQFHIPRSLRLTLKKNTFRVQINRRFEDVIRACAQRDETWISEEIIQAYYRLYLEGYAHSVEVWKGETLAGGLYGVAIGGAFFGESMFSRVRDASKVALVHLVNRLNERRYSLLDTQFVTPHLQRFGAVEIPREEYLKKLKHALTLNCSFENEEI